VTQRATAATAGADDAGGGRGSIADIIDEWHHRVNSVVSSLDELARQRGVALAGRRRSGPPAAPAAATAPAYPMSPSLSRYGATAPASPSVGPARGTSPLPSAADVARAYVERALQRQRQRWSGDFENASISVSCWNDSPDSVSSGKKRKDRSGHPKLNQLAVDYLRSWLLSRQHIEHPYPSEQNYADLSRATGVEKPQLKNWFV
jgi:hypothetical protein